MTEPVKDSVEAALDLDEREVYSHIAHESAEDIVRIISSLDAERAKLRGEVVYYRDDWDDLIRERIAKGKRHTAFDFYNPELLDIWEDKIKECKRVKRIERISYAVLSVAVITIIVFAFVWGLEYALLAVPVLPLFLLVRDTARERLDLIYYELTQFFIDELAALVEKHDLNPERYKFKIFGSYFSVRTLKTPSGIFGVVEVPRSGGNH